jgi:hypothetical protein
MIFKYKITRLEKGYLLETEGTIFKPSSSQTKLTHKLGRDMWQKVSAARVITVTVEASFEEEKGRAKCCLRSN